jgi:hypothetical protein
MAKIIPSAAHQVTVLEGEVEALKKQLAARTAECEQLRALLDTSGHPTTPVAPLAPAAAAATTAADLASATHSGSPCPAPARVAPPRYQQPTKAAQGRVVVVKAAPVVKRAERAVEAQVKVAVQDKEYSYEDGKLRAVEKTEPMYLRQTRASGNRKMAGWDWTPAQKKVLEWYVRCLLFD